MSINRLTVTQGDSKAVAIRVYKNNERLPIDGFLFSFTVKKKLTDNDDASLISRDWSEHLDAENGLTMLEILPTDTKNIAPGTYYCDIQFKSGDAVTTLFRGEFVIVHEVTKR